MAEVSNHNYVFFYCVYPVLGVPSDLLFQIHNLVQFASLLFTSLQKFFHYSCFVLYCLCWFLCVRACTQSVFGSESAAGTSGPGGGTGYGGSRGRGGPSPDTLEALISVNHKLGLDMAAAGILRQAEQQAEAGLYSLVVRPSWLEKLWRCVCDVCVCLCLC